MQGNGYKKVTVTLGFSPSATPMDDLTIGLIGANSSFAGDVYLDNLILSQKDASGDFVTITATPNTDGTQAKTEATDKILTMTDPDASNSAKGIVCIFTGQSQQKLHRTARKIVGSLPASTTYRIIFFSQEIAQKCSDLSLLSFDASTLAFAFSSKFSN